MLSPISARAAETSWPARRLLARSSRSTPGKIAHGGRDGFSVVCRDGAQSQERVELRGTPGDPVVQQVCGGACGINDVARHEDFWIDHGRLPDSRYKMVGLTPPFAQSGESPLGQQWAGRSGSAIQGVAEAKQTGQRRRTQLGRIEHKLVELFRDATG